MKTRILLVDDQALFRESLRWLIDHDMGMHVVGEAGNGTEAIEKLNEAEPDIVIIDLHLPDIDGIALSNKILEIMPRAKVIILTGDDKPRLMEDSIDSGIGAFLVKTCSWEDLHTAIEAVRQDVFFFCG